MKRQTRHGLQILCGVGMLLLLAILFQLLFPTIHWIGHTDLSVEFVVTDADTGEPIRGADISVRSGGGFNADGSRMEAAGIREERFSLTTDETGRVSRVARGSTCFGTSGPFTDTFDVHLPEWYLAVGAPGYATTEQASLDALARPREIKRVGPGQKSIAVPIALRKSRP